MEEEKTRETILCVRIGGLGDLLAALPSIRLLRSARPNARLVLLGRPDYGGLLLRAGIVDEVVDAGGSEFAPLFGGGPAGTEAGRPLLARYAFVAGWLNSPERALDLDGALAASGKARLIVGLEAIREGGEAPGESAARFFFDRTKRGLGRSPTAGGPGSAPCSFEDCARLDGPAAGPETRERFAIIHPGSGSVEKCWPLERFLEIARRLSARGIPGGIVLGEAEERLKDGLAREAGGGKGAPRDWTVLERPPLAALSYLLGRASFYLGNDSGVTHLAAARGAPVLALFLDRNLPVWAPYGRSRTISAPDIASIPVKRVWTETAAILGLERL
jgi:hypothetical protein